MANKKRYHQFSKKSDYWDAVNQLGEELVNNRSKPPILPEHQIFLETESHYALFDLRLRDKFLNKEHIVKLDEAFYKLTNYRINAVRVVKQDGFADYVYNRPAHVTLTPDSDFDTSVEFFFNFRDNAKFILNCDRSKTTDPIVSVFMKFFCLWFTDSRGKELKSYDHSITISNDVKKWLLKKKQHTAYSAPHSEFKDTPIEKAIENVLHRNNIAFKKQAEYFIQQVKFSVPDFLLEQDKIAIYCDGTEFHKEPQRIISDKTQDRKLQLNGYMVLRFSGSEIISDLLQCEEDILAAIKTSRGKG